MKAKKLAFAVLTAILACFVAAFAACDDKPKDEGEQKYTIEGVVSSSIGPLSGVTVKLGNETKTTGTAGSYSFEVDAGEYTLTFTKTGYVDVQKTVKTADATNGAVKLNVTMAVQQKEYITISGTVRDEDGVIAGATVSGDALTSTVTANEQGVYTLPELEKKGSYTFTFAASGYVSAQKTVNAADVTGATHTLDVTLDKIPEAQIATVSGTVTADYPKGAIAGVTVKIGTTEVQTGTNGAYTLQTSRDACSVEFVKDGYAKVTKEVTAEELADGTHTLNAELVRNTVLAGKTNADLVAEVANIKEIPALSSCGKTAIEQCWNAGGAAGSESDVIGEGYRMTSNTDNDSDEYRRYIYGKLAVTENTDTLTFYGRTFDNVETEFAVSVIDPETLDSAFVKASGNDTVWATHKNDDYGKYTYDLSAYNGKTVIVAIGVRKAALTVELICLTADGTFAFGRTPAAAVQGLQLTTIAAGTRYTATANPKIQDTFVTAGSAKVDNNRWMLMDARGSREADAQPHSYVFGKTTITAANARMSIRWSSYNNGDMALTKVLAVDAKTKEVIHMYSGNTSVNGEWCETGFDLTECVGKEVILAIGMSYGNRMGIDWIAFNRMSYTLTGTVTLPDNTYAMNKVSFKLDGDTLTDDEGGFTFDTDTGAYSLTLDAQKTTGTLTVSYDNAGISDNAQKLLDVTYALGAVTQDTVTKDFTLRANSTVPQPIGVTIKAGATALTDADAAITLGTHEFTYTNGKWTLTGLTMADAIALRSVTITLKGNYANIYADPSFALSSGDYTDDGVEKNITLEEKDILPGLKFSQMQNAPELVYDHYQGWRAHNVLRSFAKSNPIRSEEQNEGDTIRVREGSQKSETEFNGYVYGVKTVTEVSKTMIVNMRTHNDDNTIFGVMVVDLATGARVTVGGIRKQSGRDYIDYTFDLSAFVGKKVLIATGIFYTAECTNENMQYVIGHIRFHAFGNTWAESVDKIAQTALADTSVPAQTITDFLGSSNDKDKDNYIFKTWGTAIESEDAGDYEFGASEGALIKTRNKKKDIDNCIFLYAKFRIDAQHDYLRFNARNFGDAPELAVTVYSKDSEGKVQHTVVSADLDKFELNGNEVTAMQDGWLDWTRKNDNYVHFKFDLSAYKGQDVVIVIGLRNTLKDKGEYKAAIQEIHLDAKPQDAN